MATCGKCKATSVTVESIKACYAGQAHGKATPTCPRHGGPADDPKMVNGCWECDQERAVAKKDRNEAKVTPAGLGGATAKQIAFLTKLCQERPAWAKAVGYGPAVITGMSKLVASKAIGDALNIPKELTIIAGANDGTKNGYVAAAKKGDVHVVDGTYYRIHVGQGSGKPYACRAYISGEAQWAADGSLVRPASVRWGIAKGMIHKLTEATKATTTQAAAFGKLVGRCCFCSHAIDTPESTAVGYGPICANRFGLPWGEAVTPLEARANA